MLYTVWLSIGFLFGVVCVALWPTPTSAVGALVVASGVGCGIVAVTGSFFLALVLFLVYLGGMLVVFAFSVGMSVDIHLKFKGRSTGENFFVGVFILLCAMLWGVMINEGYWQVEFESVGETVEGSEAGFGGVCELYSAGGWSLFIVGWVLLLTLFVVLELVRWASFGALSKG